MRRSSWGFWRSNQPTNRSSGPIWALLRDPWTYGFYKTSTCKSWISILYFRTITYTCMHACARALHDAVKASTPVERNFLQLGPGPFLGWGRRFCPWYCYRKTKKTKQKKTKKKYCTVEIPTEMEFTGTFQKYLQCVNRMWFSNIRSVCLSRLTDYST